MTFIPGKKYRFGKTSQIWTMLAYHPNGNPVLIEPDGNIREIDCSFGLFTLYKEPKIHTRYIHWFQYGDLFYLYASLEFKHDDTSADYKYLKTDIVTYVEGDLDTEAETE
jgi:hypothetical protein